MMSEFDDFDLGRRLRAGAGSEPDVAAAQVEVRHRVVRARRRRMAGVSGAAAAVIVSIGLFATLDDDGGGGRVGTAETGVSSSPTEPTSTAQSTTVVDRSTTSIAERPVTTSSQSPTTAVTTSPSAPAPTAPPTSVPVELPAQPTTTAETPTSIAADASTTVPAPVDVTQPFDSIGGSIVVRLSGGQMSLLNVTPAAGYVIERQIARSDDIEVRFVSGDAESRIRVRLVNGRMEPEIDEQ